MSSTITLYIARHGKTLLNTYDKVQGWCDSFLTDEGIEVAEYLGLGMQNINLESVYTSDLGRTVQTAKVILDKKGQPDLPITQLEEFREACFGMYESDFNATMWREVALYHHYTSFDAMYADMEKRKIDNAMALDAIAELDTLKTAETFSQVESRTQRGLQLVAECEARKNKDVNVLIVSHGMSILAMLHNLGGKELAKGHLDNVSISKVTYKDGKFKIESMGDMSYVEAGKQIANK